MDRLLELIEYLNSIVWERQNDFEKRFLDDNELLSIHYGESSVRVSFLVQDGPIYFDTIPLDDFKEWLNGK